MNEVQEQHLVEGNPKRYAHNFIVNAHFETVKVKKEPTRLHSGSLVSIVEDMPGYDVPADRCGLLRDRGVLIYAEDRRLNRFQHMFKRSPIAEVLIPDKKSTAKLFDLAAVDGNYVFEY